METTIKHPSEYDWSKFAKKPRGFVLTWCDSHQYEDGQKFNYNTAKALILGNYVGGPGGRRIRGIIEAALKEGLIEEYRRAA